MQQKLLSYMVEYFVVDRIENENITIEASNGKMIVITKKDVNGISKEGDILVREDNIFFINTKETENRKARINKIMKGMWQE
ncbi:DUF3006 domain-containing protein [Clostridium sp.]|uniref:DUF3006 domain-containing protein n=1 Tax=Clostridium sp. TaxID=1506 RepID=UPI002FC5AE99